MLRWMVTLILFLLLTACQPALPPAVSETATPVEIPRAAETPTLVAAATETPLPTGTPTLVAAATATPLPTGTPTPEGTIDPVYASFFATHTAAAPTRAALAKIEPEVTHLNGLVISDTALLPAEPYTLRYEDTDDNDEFHLLLPQEIQGLSEDMLYPHSPTEAGTQAVLAQFGYRLEQMDDCCYWRLLQGETLLSDKISRGHEPFHQVNQSGTDFWMLLSVNDSQYWLLRKGSFELWYEGQPRSNPVFVGDDFFTVQMRLDGDGEKFGVEVEVKRNGETVFVYTEPGLLIGTDTCPIETFRAWEDQWLLQIDDQVIVGGQSLRDKGYARSFGWQTLGGKPYFLFQKDEDSPFGVSYNGVELPLQYDEIVYWTCDQKRPIEVANPHGSEKMATFFARKEGMWHYVKVLPEEGIRE